MVNIEKEISLIVYYDNPHLITKHISELPLLETKEGIFHTRYKTTITIIDTYYDDINNSLSKKKCALRIREEEQDISVNNDKGQKKDSKKCIVTLKKDTEKHNSEINNRLEYEIDWKDIDSSMTLLNIIKEVGEVNIDSNSPIHDVVNNAKLSPFEILKKTGLRVIQKRKTTRVIKTVSKDKDELEMDIDKVLFSYAKDNTNNKTNDKTDQVISYNIEIEAKSKDSARLLPVIGNALIEKYSPHLLRWDINKLVTGKIIQNASGLDIDSENRLMPKSYDKIRQIYYNANVAEKQQKFFVYNS